MKTPSERGVIGAWAYQARQEAGLSVEQVAAAIEAKGQAVSPATIRGIESGLKKPGARLLRLLGTVLESTPPVQTAKEPGQADLTGLVVALTHALQAQAQALTDIRLELARAVQSADQQRDETAEILGRLSRQLDELRTLAGNGAGSAALGSGRN